MELIAGEKAAFSIWAGVLLAATGVTNAPSGNADEGEEKAMPSIV
jgi:hypothetical protein